MKNSTLITSILLIAAGIAISNACAESDLPGWKVKSISREELETSPLLGSAMINELNFEGRKPSTASITGTMSTMSAPLNVSTGVAELAQALEYNPTNIYEFVRNNIEYDFQWGWIRSPERTIVDRMGTDADQAVLLTELLQASGYSTEYGDGYRTYGFSGNNGYNLEEWLDISDIGEADFMLWHTGIPYGYDLGQNTITMYRFWVRAYIDGVWVEMDPAMKPRLATPAKSIIDMSGYSRTNLLALIGGAGSSTNEIEDLDEDELRLQLTALTTNLIATLKNSFPNHSVSEIYGDRAIVPESGIGSLRGTAASTPNYASTLWASKHYIDFINTPYYVSTVDLGCQALTIEVSSNGVDGVIYLDDTPVYSGPMMQDNGTTEIAYAKPIYSQGSGYWDSDSAAYPFSAYSVNAFPIYFGNSVGAGMLNRRNQTLSRKIAEDADSAEILHASLHATGASWMNQSFAVKRFVSDLYKDTRVLCNKMGAISQSINGYGIDLKHGYQIHMSDGDIPETVSLFNAPEFMSSALEHGVLEQSQPGKADAVSTIELLTLASRNGDRIFRVTADNYASIEPQLTNYHAQALSAIDNLIYNQNQTVILPEDAAISLNSWTGLGYISTSPGNIAFSIGELDGGYDTLGNPYDPYLLNTLLGLDPLTPWDENHPLSIEPVDMVTGAYILNHDDLTMSSPMGLKLSRNYSSASRYSESEMGFGWSHSLNMRVQEQSDPQSMLGGRTSEDAAAIGIAMMVIKDMLQYEDNAKGWVAAVLTAKWAMDQLTENAVSVVTEQSSGTFIKQPDGSFTPPPGMTVALQHTNGVYVMQERNANTYTFNTNNLIATISDPNTNTLTFAYDASTNLYTATSSFGQQFTFNYTGDLLTSVTDNSSPSRTIEYQYDSNNNLTNFVDAADHEWGITYDSDHKIKTLVDPEEITTIQNFYNTAAQVTNQISATGHPWNFYFAGSYSIEEDAYGNQTTYYYDGQNRTWSIEKADGSRTYSFFDGQNHVTNAVNEAGVTNVFVFDKNNNLLAQTNALGTAEEVATHYGYDSENHLRFVTNAVGTADQTVIEMTYTATHKPDTITAAVGTADEVTTDFDYYSNGLLQRKSEGNGLRVTTYTDFDSFGNAQMVRATDAGDINRTFNSRGDLLSVTVDGTTTAFGYNALRQPTSVTNALGTIDQAVTSQTYWKNGLLKTTTDARSNTTRRYWTPAYKPAGTVFPNLGSTTNIYDAADRLVRARDAEGNWATNTLDTVGRSVFVSSVHSAVSNRFDTVGNLTNSVTDPSGLNLWTASEYDSLNRPISVSSVSSVIQNKYNSLNQLTNRIDAASKPWKTEFDSLGRVKKTFRPSENYEETEYNALGYRTTFWNAERNPIHFGVDAQGRITAITNAIGKVTSFTFDDAGNLTDREDAKNEVTHYAYDFLNRLISITNEGAWKASFDYDPNGNIVEHASPLAQTQFGYDEMNRLTASTCQVSSIEFQVSNSYDLNGNRTNIIYPGGLEVSYSYGADNRLESVITEYTENTKTISFGYDTASRLAGIAYPNGINTTFGYDAESRVTNIVHGTFVDRKIQRNALGFKTTECINAGIKPTVPNTFRSLKTHNAADQLTSERIQAATTNWTTIDYEYNDNGGLETVLPANKTSTSYSYDYDNRLIRVDSGNSRSEYILDAGGSRIARIHANGTSAVTNYFVIDYTDGLKRPLAETDASGNVTRFYVWSNMRLLAHIDISAEGGEIHYYHSDELGSTLALSDESGSVTDQFAYMPYGYATHTGSTETPFQWLGGYGVYYDSDTDLHLTLHRAYSSKMKRFISPDPLGIDGGANVYMWANMNPLWFVDPYGLCADTGKYLNKWTLQNRIRAPIYMVQHNLGERLNRIDNAVNQFRETTGIASVDRWLERNAPGYKAVGDFLERPEVQLGMILALGTTIEAPSSPQTFLYQKLGPNGEHLKYGITKNPATRYTKKQMGGGRLKILSAGEKSEMLRLERSLHETLPVGPEEGQLFYIQKQIDKGLKPPPYQ